MDQRPVGGGGGEGEGYKILPKLARRISFDRGAFISLPFEINSTKKHVVKLNIRNIDILYP